MARASCIQVPLQSWIVDKIASPNPTFDTVWGDVCHFSLLECDHAMGFDLFVERRHAHLCTKRKTATLSRLTIHVNVARESNRQVGLAITVHTNAALAFTVPATLLATTAHICLPPAPTLPATLGVQIARLTWTTATVFMINFFAQEVLAW